MGTEKGTRVKLNGFFVSNEKIGENLQGGDKYGLNNKISDIGLLFNFLI